MTRISSVLVHLPDVDEAFPKLMHSLDQLQVAVLNGDDWPILEGRFRLAGAMAIRIFRREEEAMDLCHDRGALFHRQAHQKFLKTFLMMKSQCEQDGPSVPLAQDLKTEVIGWISDHHRIMNASLGRLVKDMVERSVAHHESTNGPITTSG